MNSDFRICAVIPAYNEEETIANVVEKARNYVDEVFVVADGSSDNTAEVARDAGAKIIRHVLNRGIGAAQRTGYNVAIKESFDYVVQLDGDMQHDPQYISQLVKAICENNCDIVIGSRFLNESNKEYNSIRRMGIKFFTKTVKFLSDANITDVTSGFRIYKVETLKNLGKTSDGHWAIEQTLEAGKKNMKIKEISVKMPLRKEGKSQFNVKTYFLYPLRMVDSILKILIFRR
jgi:glycosyltransferase involved in cell wall biosynthesis